MEVKLLHELKFVHKCVWILGLVPNFFIQAHLRNILKTKGHKKKKFMYEWIMVFDLLCEGVVVL